MPEDAGPWLSYLGIDAYERISFGVEFLLQGNDNHLELFLSLLFDVTRHLEEDRKCHLVPARKGQTAGSKDQACTRLSLQPQS